MLIDIPIKFREYSLSGFHDIERTWFVTDRQTDGRTDRQTDGRPGKNNMSPNPEGGRHNKGNWPCDIDDANKLSFPLPMQAPYGFDQPSTFGEEILHAYLIVTWLQGGALWNRGRTPILDYFYGFRNNFSFVLVCRSSAFKPLNWIVFFWCSLPVIKGFGSGLIIQNCTVWLIFFLSYKCSSLLLKDQNFYSHFSFNCSYLVPFYGC